LNMEEAELVHVEMKPQGIRSRTLCGLARASARALIT
jgi:hypothetical protein